MSSTLIPFCIEKEFIKNPEISAADIASLRAWLKTQPHLPAEYISDLDLLLTFHCCKQSTAVTKQVLDLHFTLRTLFVNFFQDRKVDKNVLKSFDVALLTILQKRSYQDEAVCFYRLLDYDIKNYNFPDLVKASFMVLDLYQQLEGTWPGMIIVIDLSGVTLSHITKLDLQTIQQVLYFLQEAMLVKLQGIHFLNAPSFMDRLMLILKPFLKKELQGSINIHQIGSETINKFIPIDALPVESEFGKMKDDIKQKINDHADYFLQENKKRVNENARPGRAKTLSDIFQGMEGSFKKLDID